MTDEEGEDDMQPHLLIRDRWFTVICSGTTCSVSQQKKRMKRASKSTIATK